MKIIAIDTATDVCGVTYLVDGEIIHTIEAVSYTHLRAHET